MRRLLFTALLGVVASLCACVPHFELRESTGPDHGGIFMAAEFKGEEFPYWRRHRAAELFFQKLLPDGGLDPKLVPANYRAGDLLYALDLPPGQYALVAASYFTGRTRQLASFEGDRAKQWVVEVKPGELSFGGAIQLPRRMPGWDVVLENGLRRLASYLPPFRRAVIPMTLGPARTDRSRGVELQALRLARFDLRGSGWGRLVDEKLRELGNPPPVLTTGTFRKKPVPRLRAASFTWIDTLGWGAPQAVPGGLRWRRPKAQAAISVAFVPKAGAGARSLEAELKTLREAGSPEDTHSLTEVAVSSRTALAALYTSYLYPETVLVGSEVKVVRTQALIVPVEAGYYKIQYRASSEEFDRSRPDFERFIRYLDLATPPPVEKT